MDKKMKGKLFLAGVSLGLTFAEAYFQHKKSKNKDEKIEKLITEVRNELGGSRIEITPKHINVRTEKLDVIDGVDLTLDTNEITVNKHEKQFNSLSSKVDTLEANISRRLEELEDEVFTPVEDTTSLDSDEENTVDKSPVLSEEDDKTTKSIIEMVSHLDENYLNKLCANLDGTYVYDMEDFHALVTQLFILQEAEKAKYTEKEV